MTTLARQPVADFAGCAATIPDRVCDALLLGLELCRHARAERIEIVADSGDFAAPVLRIDIEQRFERVIAELEPVTAKIALARHEADRRLFGLGGAVAAADDPFEHAQVVAVAGPEELAVGALAEPVDVEDLRQLRARLVEREPVREVVAVVVAAERLHRHRVAAQHANGAGRGGGRFRTHRRADEHAVFPVARFEHERHERRATSAENDRGDRHALAHLRRAATSSGTASPTP